MKTKNSIVYRIYSAIRGCIYWYNSPQILLIRSLGMANPQLKTYFIVLLASKKNFKALILDLGWRIPIKAGISKVVVVFLILK